MPEKTFPSLLAAQLKVNPGRPFLTWYDDATGERVELSVTTYANWVLKTANLFIDEYGLDEGDTVLLDLPNHWLTPVFVGAAWYAGLIASTVNGDPDNPHDLLVCGPDRAREPVGTAVPVLACSLLPFAVRFHEPLPRGVDDYGLLWPGQPDAFVGPETQATPRELWRGADSRDLSWEGSRLLTDESLLNAPGLLSGALDRSASLVLVNRPSADGWQARAEAENATDVRRCPAPGGAGVQPRVQ